MSIAKVDHAGWVAANMPHHKKAVAGRRPKRGTFGEKKGWHAAPDELTAFHERVFDILGMTFGGIYNAPISWDAIQWVGYGRDGIGIPVRWPSLSTWDGMALTRLVFLCHAARIRCDISNHGPRGMLLAFWQRSESGGMGERHPNLAEAVEMFRAYLPDDHRIIHRASQIEEVTA